jgi:hypothetical protein
MPSWLAKTHFLSCEKYPQFGPSLRMERSGGTIAVTIVISLGGRMPTSSSRHGVNERNSMENCLDCSGLGIREHKDNPNRVYTCEYSNINRWILREVSKDEKITHLQPAAFCPAKWGRASLFPQGTPWDEKPVWIQQNPVLTTPTSVVWVAWWVDRLQIDSPIIIGASMHFTGAIKIAMSAALQIPDIASNQRKLFFQIDEYADQDDVFTLLPLETARLDMPSDEWPDWINKALCYHIKKVVVEY